MVVTDASKKNRPRAWEPYVCQGVLGVVLVVAAVVRHREFAVFFGGGERCLDQPAVNGGERSVPPRGARSFCTIVSSPRGNGGSKRGEIEAVLAHALGHAVYVFSALGRRRAFDPEDSSQSISTFPRSCFRRLRNKRSRVSEAHTSPRIAPSRVCLTTSATMPRDMTGTCRFALCNVLHVFLSSTSRVRGPVDAPMPRTVRSLCFGLWGRRWFASRGRYVP